MITTTSNDKKSKTKTPDYLRVKSIMHSSALFNVLNAANFVEIIQKKIKRTRH